MLAQSILLHHKRGLPISPKSDASAATALQDICCKKKSHSPLSASSAFSTKYATFLRGIDCSILVTKEQNLENF